MEQRTQAKGPQTASARSLRCRSHYSARRSRSSPINRRAERKATLSALGRVSGVHVNPCAKARGENHGDPLVRGDFVSIRGRKLGIRNFEYGPVDPVAAPAGKFDDRMMRLAAFDDDVLIFDERQRLLELL